MPDQMSGDIVAWYCSVLRSYSTHASSAKPALARPSTMGWLRDGHMPRAPTKGCDWLLLGLPAWIMVRVGIRVRVRVMVRFRVRVRLRSPELGLGFGLGSGLGLGLGQD